MFINKLIIIIFISLYAIDSSFCQFSNIIQSDIENTLKKETSVIEKKQQSPILLSIGISAPKINPKLTRKQALERVIIRFGLMDNSLATCISDIYSANLNENNKYKEIYRCNRNGKLEGQCCIIDSFETRYGKKNLLVKFQHNKSYSIPINIRISLYKSITKTDNRWFTSFEISNIYNKDSILLIYNYLQDNKNYSITSIFGRDTISISLGMYQYETNINGQCVENNIQMNHYIELSNKGLWSGYLLALLNNISTFATEEKFTIKMLMQT